MKNRRIIVAIICIAMLNACEKSEKSSMSGSAINPQRAYLESPTTNQMDSLSNILGFNLLDFSESESFNHYLDFLDTVEVLYLLTDSEPLLEVMRSSVFAEMAYEFPTFSNLTYEQQNDVINTSIGYVCMGMKKAEKRLTAYREMLHYQYKHGWISVEEYYHNLQIAVQQFNLRYNRNYPYDRMYPNGN